MDTGGNYRIGVLEGTVTGTYEARFIGAGARENYRRQKIEEQEEYTPFVEEPEQKQTLPEQLAACEKTELIAWMMEYAKENRGFWDYLQLRVSKQLQETEFLVILNRTCNRFFSRRIAAKKVSLVNKTLSVIIFVFKRKSACKYTLFLC